MSLTKSEINRLFGEISDHSVAEILSLKPEKSVLEAVALRLEQEDDILGEARRPLERTEAQIYEILLQDDLFRDDVNDRPQPGL